MQSLKIVQSHYNSAIKTIKSTINRAGNIKVIDVKPLSDQCKESYPCQGHDGANLKLADGSWMQVPCDPVSIGALELFYLPVRYENNYTGDKHFINYIDQECFNKIVLLRIKHERGLDLDEDHNTGWSCFNEINEGPQDSGFDFISYSDLPEEAMDFISVDLGQEFDVSNRGFTSAYLPQDSDDDSNNDFISHVVNAGPKEITTPPPEFASKHGMLSCWYIKAIEVITETVTKVGTNKVVHVTPIKEWPCLESYPCQGHEGALLTFENGQTLAIKCGSVAIGALEVFYLPERMNASYQGSRHFLEYINESFFVELCELRERLASQKIEKNLREKHLLKKIEESMKIIKAETKKMGLYYEELEKIEGIQDLEPIPTRFTVVRDVDLINGLNVTNKPIITIEKLNQANYNDLTSFKVSNYWKAVTKFICDICKNRCSEDNPIYTNNKYSGVDVCTKCVEKALSVAKPSSDSQSVYSLKEIQRIARE